MNSPECNSGMENARKTRTLKGFNAVAGRTWPACHLLKRAAVETGLGLFTTIVKQLLLYQRSAKICVIPVFRVFAEQSISKNSSFELPTLKLPFLTSTFQPLTSSLLPAFFTVHRLPFTVYCSPFTVYCSPFTVHCLLFTVYCLLFTSSVCDAGWMRK